jgi:hypothetical protein
VAPFAGGDYSVSVLRWPARGVDAPRSLLKKLEMRPMINGRELDDDDADASRFFSRRLTVRRLTVLPTDSAMTRVSGFKSRPGTTSFAMPPLCMATIQVIG